MKKKQDHEIGNYFYNKRLAEGTLREKTITKWEIQELWNTIVALFWLALIIIVAYVKTS